jgi:hypothetical protein
MRSPLFKLAATVLITASLYSASASAVEAPPSVNGETAIPSESVVPEPSEAPLSTELPGISAINYARIGAIADSVTTHIALNSGGVEKNALVNTSPAGLVALLALKLGLLELAERLPENERAMAIKTSAAVWGGVSVNNLLVAASVGGAAPVVVGAAFGYWMWEHTSDRLAAEKLAKAAKADLGTAVSP